jgi:hypothetical protein
MGDLMNENVTYQGKIVEVVQRRVIIDGSEKIFEFVRRAPGVRLIIPTEKGLIMTREYRQELGDWDYRLPGGKVFDTLVEYNKFLKTGEDIRKPALAQAINEARQEAGIVVQEIDLFQISKNGATVVWDLIYFVVSKYEKSERGQELESGEKIKVLEISWDEVKAMCFDGRMQEDRTVGILVKYLHAVNKL